MSSSKYDTNVDPASNTSHARMLRMVGSNKRVLDVGCSTGYLARALGDQGCTVAGVEYDEGAAAEARPHLTRVVVGDLETLDLPQAFEGERFDVIVFGDVLEHLKNPLPVLRSSRALLADGGAVVVSVPNIAHADIRLSLLQGRFNYRDLGLLDVTHVRFFTRENLKTLLREAGFVAIDVQTTTAPVFGTELADDARGLPDDVLRVLEDDIDATTYQFVVKAAADDAVQLAAESAWRLAEVEKELVAAKGLVGAAENRADASEQVSLRAVEEAASLREENARLAASAERADEHLRALEATKIVRGMRLPRAAYAKLRSSRR